MEFTTVHMQHGAADATTAADSDAPTAAARSAAPPPRALAPLLAELAAMHSQAHHLGSQAQQLTAGVAASLRALPPHLLELLRSLPGDAAAWQLQQPLLPSSDDLLLAALEQHVGSMRWQRQHYEQQRKQQLEAQARAHHAAVPELQFQLPPPPPARLQDRPVAMGAAAAGNEKTREAATADQQQQPAQHAKHQAAAAASAGGCSSGSAQEQQQVLLLPVVRLTADVLKAANQAVTAAAEGGQGLLDRESPQRIQQPYSPYINQLFMLSAADVQRLVEAYVPSVVQLLGLSSRQDGAAAARGPDADAPAVRLHRLPINPEQPGWHLCQSDAGLLCLPVLLTRCSMAGNKRLNKGLRSMAQAAAGDAGKGLRFFFWGAHQ
jgi:hypothetical protein